MNIINRSRSTRTSQINVSAAEGAPKESTKIETPRASTGLKYPGEMSSTDYSRVSKPLSVTSGTTDTRGERVRARRMLKNVRAYSRFKGVGSARCTFDVCFSYGSASEQSVS